MRMADEYDVGKAFAAIEKELMASMIRNMQNHKVEEVNEQRQWAMWQVEQLKALEGYKRKNKEVYGKKFQDINKQIDELIRMAKVEGERNQETAILQAIKRGSPARRVPPGASAEFFRLNERKLEALLTATQNDMQKAETAILRMSNDRYRRVIFNAQVYANTGAGTYEKAVDMATKDFISAGLNCVEYRNGARHTLSDYADMAIRTASKRAYLQGEGQKRKEWGIATVIMNKRGNPCPKCLPFCGKILIDDVWSGGTAEDGPYPLMSAAISAGLYHPRCKDSHTTYFPGISTPPDSEWKPEEIAKIEKDAKKEVRQQYARRQTEKYGRLAEFSLDPDNKEKYAEKQEQWKNVCFKTGNVDQKTYVETQRLKEFFGIPNDITEKWTKKKVKAGVVKNTYEYISNGKTYKVDGKNVLLDYSDHERKIADIIAIESGNNVEMIPRINFPEKIQTPDYLINGSKFDLKTPLGASKNTIYGMVKSKKKQANNFVICLDETALSMEEVENQINDIYRSRHTAFVDRIILVKGGRIEKAYERKK